jgi:hypothetical protein
MGNWVLVGSLSIFVSACDDDRPPPSPLPDTGAFDAGPPRDAARPDGSADSGRFDGSPGDAGPIPRADIDCVYPTFGAMEVATPGSRIEFAADVADPEDVTNVTVNGAVAMPGETGVVRSSVGVDFGHNHVEVVATYRDGRVVRQLCSFVAAPSYLAEGDELTGAVSMRISGAGIDDGSMVGPINSLNDFVLAVLEGGLLRDTLHARFSDPSVSIKSCSCDVMMGTTCSVSTEAIYQDIAVGASNTSSLRAIEGGVNFRGTVRDIALTIRLQTCPGSSVSFSEIGTVSFESISVDVDFDTLLLGGRFAARTRRVNSVTLGAVTASFPTLSPLFRTTVEMAVVRHITGPDGATLRASIGAFIETELEGLLDALLATIDIRSLGGTFAMPSIAGRLIAFDFASSYTSHTASASGLEFRLGTSYESPPSIAIPTDGMPARSLAFGATSTAVRPVGNKISDAVMNLVAHSYWRAGGLDGILGPDMVGILGPDMDVGPDTILGPDMMILGPDMIARPDGLEIESALPVVVQGLSSGDMRVTMGGLTANLMGDGTMGHPFGAGVEIRFGATAEARVTADSGENPLFEEIAITDVWFVAAQGMTTHIESAVFEFLVLLAWDIADTALNAARDRGVALPLPSFETNATLMRWGLTPGVEFGTVMGSISQNPTHFELVGDFGERP